MATFIPIDKEGKKFLNLDTCVTIERANFLNETKPVYYIKTVNGETVVIRTDEDLTNRILKK